MFLQPLSLDSLMDDQLVALASRLHALCLFARMCVTVELPSC